MTDLHDKEKGEKMDFEIAEFRAWGGYTEDYFLEVLNGEKSIEQARDDLESFRNSEYYTGTKGKYFYKEKEENL